MIGYYENEKATKEAIIDGWFYTGDLGYKNEEGYLFITGRKKEVIVLRNGENVYPSDIEFLVNKLPYVKESLLFPRKNYKKELNLGIKIVYDKDEIKKAFPDKKEDEYRDLIWRDIKEIIKGTNDPEYEKKCIEERDKFNINNDGITNLVEHINDSSYTEEIISRRDEFGFSQEETVAIIAGAESNFIKDIIEDDSRVKEFELNSNQIVDLIIAAGKEYITEVIGSKEKLEKFGLNKTELGRLVLATKDTKYIDAYLKQYGKKEEKGIDKKIKLPESMTIGTEIESEGSASREILGLSKVFEEGWECKQDLSTDDGVEVVSPKLTGDSEKTTEI